MKKYIVNENGKRLKQIAERALVVMWKTQDECKEIFYIYEWAMEYKFLEPCDYAEKFSSRTQGFFCGLWLYKFFL